MGRANRIASFLVRRIFLSIPLASGAKSEKFVLTGNPMRKSLLKAISIDKEDARRQLGLNPRIYAMLIALAASCSFLTPLEPACLLVYGPGRYRFVDFLKVGSLLTLLVCLIAIAMVPLLWPVRSLP